MTCALAACAGTATIPGEQALYQARPPAGWQVLAFVPGELHANYPDSAIELSRAGRLAANDALTCERLVP